MRIWFVKQVHELPYKIEIVNKKFIYIEFIFNIKPYISIFQFFEVEAFDRPSFTTLLSSIFGRNILKESEFKVFFDAD